MKKLLIFMLVLGMASLANATLTWSITGNSGPGALEVEPSDVITITLSLSGGNSNGLSFGVVTDQGAGGTMTDSLLAAGYDAIHFDGFTAAEAAAAGMSGTYGLGDAVYIVGATSATAVSGTLVTLYYTVDPAAVIGSTINIITQMGEFGSLDTVNVGGTEVKPATLGLDVVPEPMTVLLLGLGGLFLRRRKGRS